jgi:hypothetical protein
MRTCTIRERARALLKVRALQKVRALHTDTSGIIFFEAVNCSTNCASANGQRQYLQSVFTRTYTIRPRGKSTVKG